MGKGGRSWLYCNYSTQIANASNAASSAGLLFDPDGSAWGGRDMMLPAEVVEGGTFPEGAGAVQDALSIMSSCLHDVDMCVNR